MVAVGGVTQSVLKNCGLQTVAKFVSGYYYNIEEKDPSVLIYRCHTSGCPVLVWCGSQRSSFYHRSPRLVAYGKSYG
ncbi:MAG: hypothetical protein M3530_01855 [Thermoproteota archaeon]|nr:hypothetical protein [Thermoproteota archaeon]